MRIYIHFKYVNELNTKLKFKMNLVKLNLNIHNLEMVSELIYETDKNLFGTFLIKIGLLLLKTQKTDNCW